MTDVQDRAFLLAAVPRINYIAAVPAHDRDEDRGDGHAGQRLNGPREGGGQIANRERISYIHAECMKYGGREGSERDVEAVIYSENSSSPDEARPFYFSLPTGNLSQKTISSWDEIITVSGINLSRNFPINT